MRARSSVLLLALAFCTLDVSAAPAKESASRTPVARKGSMFYGKPLVSLKLELEYCSYSLYVNGGLVAMNLRPMAANEIHPLNHWLRRGENLIELRMQRTPTAEEWARTKAKFSLQVGQIEGADDTTTELARTVWSGGAGTGSTAGSSPAGKFDSARGMSESKSGDVEIGAPVVTDVPARKVVSLKRVVRLPLPFREWAFLRSDPMPDPDTISEEEADKLYNELLEAFQPLWAGIKSRNLDAIMPMFQERSQEVDEALFKPPGYTQARMKETLLEALDDPAFALQPARPPEGKSFILALGANSRLATLVYNAKGSAVLRFSSKDEAGKSYAKAFPTFWRRSQQKLVVAR